jgi:hypothetical protein
MHDDGILLPGLGYISRSHDSVILRLRNVSVVDILVLKCRVASGVCSILIVPMQALV